MDRDTFLIKLRQTLAGNLPAVEIEEHVEYYRDYMNAQIRMGMSEEAVLESLGDPRLIAKSILNASTVTVEEGEYREAKYSGQDTEYQPESRRMQFVKKTPNWLKSVAVVAGLLLVFGIVFRVVAFLLPVVLPIVAVMFLVKFFRDWLH